MKTADANVVDWQIITAHRSGSDTVPKDYIRFKRLLKGSEGAPNNYELTLAHIVGNPPVPSHRHNFDQFRFALTDGYTYLPDHPIPAGSLGYFPEGAPYGPEYSSGDPMMISLQFGGPSGFGYMSMDQLLQANDRLRERGTFEHGLYKGPDKQGQQVELDGYEAAWAEAMNAPLQYPEPRYVEPILMCAQNFRWRKVANGVERKLLGTFTEGREEAALLKFEAGAAWSDQLDDRTELLFVLSGDVSINGYKAGQHHAIELDPRTETKFESNAGAELLTIHLPAF